MKDFSVPAGAAPIEPDQASSARKTARDIAVDLRARGMGCNCDLDNWQPESSTGHSWVCRIHKAACAQAGIYP